MVRKGLNSLLGRSGWTVAIIGLMLIAGGLWAVSAQSPQIDDAAILAHLNAAISWYQHLNSLDVAAGEPSDTLYLENARDLANQALQLAFQSAQAEAGLLQSEKSANASPSSGATPSQDNSTQQGISKAATDVANDIQQTKSQIDTLTQQIAKAGSKQRQQLTAQRDALQGELDLDQALQDALGKISSFVSSSENTNNGLQGKINELKRSVPDLAGTASGGKAKAAAAQQNAKSSRADASGLFGQASVLFSQMGDIHDLDQLIAETERLRSTAQQLQAPLRVALKSMIQQGRDAANQPATSDPAQAKKIRNDLEALTAEFKLISNAAVPLRQEMILLDQTHANLVEWRGSILREYKHVLRSLLTRVFVILIALALVGILSEVWKRATYRYVHEVRRRRQLLLVRRFVMGFFMVIVIAMGFISEFSSLATFAGFITAGIAVALQTVILSVAAYFFLIGRYGVRVGDRITVSGVTGDVIEVGIVRLYMMELAGTGVDLFPTGRVVVFANSVLFQAQPLFKQIPGTAYAWHEITLELAPGADTTLVEKELLGAVTSVYADYRTSIEQQHVAVERLMDATLATPAPRAQLRFGDNGLEFVVRYPVEIHRASEIDDQVTRKLLETIAREEGLKAAVSGSPKLRSAIKA